MEGRSAAFAAKVKSEAAATRGKEKWRIKNILIKKRESFAFSGADCQMRGDNAHVRQRTVWRSPAQSGKRAAKEQEILMAATETAAPFADDFAPATQENWVQRVETALKGAPLQKLVSQTYDGFDIQPLYSRASGKPRAFRPETEWAVVARLDHPDAAEANALALTDLENGATGLHVAFAGAIGAYGFGLPDAAALAPALAGVHLDAGLKIVLDLPAQAEPFVAAWLDLVSARGYEPGKIDVSLGIDPIGAAIAQGVVVDWVKAGYGLATQAALLASHGFDKGVIAADGRVVHAAGGSPAQELAFALASGLASLRALEAGGIDLDAARKMIDFRLAADADEFVTLAKFRALRRLWAGVERACGLEPHPIRVHAETAWRMMTRRDPWVNLLRETVAVFSAGLGGADSICVLPFTQAIGLPDAFARRLARNTQLVLLEESNLGKVADPAAGSGGVEALTDALVERGYALMQDIEKAGGLAAALEAGLIQTEVAKVAVERMKNVSRRKEPLTGASEFPDINEKPVSVLLPAPAAEAPGAKALARHRLAEPFEALRDQADAAEKRPAIFLANLGPVAAFTARATFAKNFFEAGGVAALGNDGFADAAVLAEGFKASGARLAVLCSSDAVYAEQGVATAKALTDAGALLYLAGRPGEMEAQWREAGVRDFVFVGCDLLTQLREALGQALLRA
jgi:methylmalonyl-CoA mutase